MKEGIRIIGGTFRGKKIAVPEMTDLRPTPNRIRETLFNWLMQDIAGAHCLDAFAGSGALGFEAFSRGAAQVTLLEQSPLACQQLQKTLQQFNSPKLRLIATDAYLYLQQPSPSYDIIFLDPPFASKALPQCLSYVSQNTILKTEGLLYLESDLMPSLPETHWQTLRCKKAGQVHYGLFRKLT